MNDKVRCPRCDSDKVKLLGKAAILSGKCIGICQKCGENFVVEPFHFVYHAPEPEQAPLW